MEHLQQMKTVYNKPSVRVVPVMLENTLCGSPEAGGLEDIGYDDWMDNDN